MVRVMNLTEMLPVDASEELQVFAPVPIKTFLSGWVGRTEVDLLGQKVGCLALDMVDFWFAALEWSMPPPPTARSP